MKKLLPLALLLSLSQTQVAAADIPADKRALILLRVLAYDRNLPQRAGDSVRIAVLYRIGDAGSEQEAAGLTAAIAGAARTVANRPVRVVAIPYRAQSLERDLASAAAAAVYVCPGLAVAVPGLAQVTQKLDVLSFTEEESLVRNGLAIGLARRGTRAAVLVNLAAARAEGSDLSAELLRLAEVLR